jgi:hypothetical protein
MSNTVPTAIAVLLFAFVLSIWNWTTNAVPGSAGAGLDWIMLIFAGIVALVSYLFFSSEF